MKTLNFSIKINAPVKKVWHTMLDPETYKEWAGSMMPDGQSGGHYVGKWEEGTEIKFLGPNPDGTYTGMICKVQEVRPYEYMSMEGVGIVFNDVEDRTSDIAKEWLGGIEAYTFTESNGVTDLAVRVDTAEAQEADFNEMWPKGLAKLKELSENA